MFDVALMLGFKERITRLSHPRAVLLAVGSLGKLTTPMP